MVDKYQSKILQSYFKSDFCKGFYNCLFLAGKKCLKQIAQISIFDDNKSMDSDKSDSNQFSTEKIFWLEVQIPEQLPRKIIVHDRILAGLDPRNDLILIEKLVKAKHLLFTKLDNDLSVQYLGNDGDTYINNLPLEKDKLYLLVKNDVITIGKISIIAREGMGQRSAVSATKSTPQIKASLELNANVEEISTEHQVPDYESSESNPKNKLVEESKIEKDRKWIDFSTINLIPYKVYGFMMDVFLTYVVLACLLPILDLHRIVQDFIYPVSDFLASIISQDKNLQKYQFLSMIEFFIFFHFVMIFSALIFGNTPGSFLVGLRQKRKDQNFLTIRFKAYLYCLINILLLPFLIFDIPFLKGKSIKELLTFSEREKSHLTIFRISRIAICPAIIFFALLFPLILPFPFNVLFSEDKVLINKYKDVQTNRISSSSEVLGITLVTDLPARYKLLPYLDENRLGFMLYDLSTKKVLIIKEESRIPQELALFKLRYSNPFASFNIPDINMSSNKLKAISLRSLFSTPNKLNRNFTKFGPFMANSFIYREEFFKNFSKKDQFLLIPFDKFNPAIKISDGKEERLFIFTKKEIVEFSLSMPQKSNLPEVFWREVASKLTFAKNTLPWPRDPGIFEAFEAFEFLKYQPILTYYSMEVNKANETDDSFSKLILKKNLEQTKKALNSTKYRKGMTSNVEKAFNKLILNISLSENKK